MTTSDEGKRFIKSFEQCRLSVYLDQGDKPTIGWGHLVRIGDDVRTLTQAEADALFDMDIDNVERQLNKLLKRTLKQHEYDALVSFLFNLGVRNLKGSGLLQAVNNARDAKTVRMEFLRWVFYRNSRNEAMRSRGLIKRRDLESRMYTEGEYVLA